MYKGKLQGNCKKTKWLLSYPNGNSLKDPGSGQIIIQ